MSETLRAKARLVPEEAWNKGNLSVLDRICVIGYVHHDPANPQVKDLVAYKELIEASRSAGPDLRFTVHDEIAEGDTVVLRWTFTSTSAGEFMGIPPTGQQIDFSGISIYRFDDGKLVEQWDEWDALGWLQQLGVIPPLEGDC